jgi:hypothetical protein
MDIVEILLLTLSVPGMFLVLLILTRVEEWLGEYTEDGWAPRPAGTGRPPLLPVRATSRIWNICRDRKYLAKLLVARTNWPNAGLTFKRQ